MANTKVRCRGCDNYVLRVDARRRGAMGWSCSELCDYNIRERQRTQQREKQRLKRILQPETVSDLSTKKKARIRRRDNDRCRWCGATSNLHVHHIIYKSQGGSNDDWNLITLCLRCHDRVHSDKKTFQPIFLAAQWMHYVQGKLAIGIVTTARHLGLPPEVVAAKKPRP